MALNGLTPAKLIFDPKAAFVGIATYASAGGVSESIKTALTATLSSAGRGGIGVPLQACVDSTSQATFVEGLYAADPFNRVTVYASPSKKHLTDGNGNDIYAKLTTATGDWLLGYFSMVAGVETAFNMPAGTVVDFDIPYLFTAAHYPSTAGIAQTERHAAPDLASYGWREQTDQLIISAQNTTTTTLSKTYDGRKAVLNLFGIIFTDKGANPAFQITGGNTFVWNTANAGTPIDIGDNPLLTYTY